MSNQKIIDAVTIVISSARISTYENATGGKKPDSLEALNLYLNEAYLTPPEVLAPKKT